MLTWDVISSAHSSYLIIKKKFLSCVQLEIFNKNIPQTYLLSFQTSSTLEGRIQHVSNQRQIECTVALSPLPAQHFPLAFPQAQNFPLKQVIVCPSAFCILHHACVSFLPCSSPTCFSVSSIPCLAEVSNDFDVAKISKYQSSCYQTSRQH